jgi:lysophospholipase L1-like esterase
VILCTPGVIGENLRSPTPENRLLDQYAEASRNVAASNGARLCDLRAAFTGYLEENNTKGRYEGILTYDGVHLNAEGNRFVARQVVHILNQELGSSPQPPAGENPYRS